VGSRDLATHLPRLQLRHLASGMPAGAATTLTRGGLLFTDFTGFTRLAEELGRSGPRGAELLSQVLNRHFGLLIAEVDAQGGDILAFAGDAVLALFESGPDDDAGAAAAARCAIAVQAKLVAMPDAGPVLGLRATVGAGDVLVHHVGGLDGHWLTVAGGAALDEVFATDRVGRASRAGYVHATDAAWSAIGDRALGARGPGGEKIVRAVHEDGAPRHAVKIAVGPELSKMVAAAVPPVLRDWHADGGADFLAEFREASLAFISLPGLDPGAPDARDRLHSAARESQEVIARLGGTFYQILYDDKATYMVAAFGLPGQARDDDAARAAEAAQAACARLAGAGIPAAAGVASGPVFCGSYGGASRSNYGIIGATINRAARLMQAADRRVLCDAATRTRAQRWLRFTDAGTLVLDGVTGPVAVHEPGERRSGSNPAGGVAEPAHAHGAMIGRLHESDRLRARLDALAAGGPGGVVVIEAEAGVGKTTLLGRVRELAAERGLRVLDSGGEPIEENTAYFAFRALIRDLLGVPPSDDAAAIRCTLLDRLAALGSDRVELAPLLNALLPADFPENELTLQMAGSIRAQNLSRLVADLVVAALGGEPLVLALEDAHWTDGASLYLCVHLAEHVPAALLIVTARPMDTELPAYTRLRTGPGRERLELGSLEPDEIVELVRRRLGASVLPVAVKKLILDKAEGNAFYAEELAATLRESGAITIVKGQCRIRAGELGTLALPDTVKGIVTGRIDRLDSAVRLTLKVASVAGRVFERRILERLHPDPGAALDAHLDALCAAELVVRQADGSYTFRHALTHETTYGLLPYAQRQPLHRAAAEHLEAVHADDLAPVYARLAFHWSRAGEPARAVPYLGEAGRQALEAHANQAAVEFFGEAIRLDEELRGSLQVDLVRGRWHRQLAEGHYSLMQWDLAQAHYERAVQLCGFRRPRFGAATLLEVGRHVAGRFVPRAVGGRQNDSMKARELCIEALRACDNLQVVYLWQGKQLSLAHTVFEGANIAERAGPSAESAFARAMIGYLLAMARLRGVAERDLRAAVAMAEESGQLLQQVSCNMYLGMTLSLLGRPLEGMPYLERADELVGRLGGGLWKHRGKYMLAEPNLMIGNLPRAAELFRACAALSMSVEPPITGFANAMHGLCRIRQGAVEEALDLIRGPTGIQLVRDNPLGLQLYNTLGALIEGCLWTGELDEALAAGREAVAIPERGDDANAFFTGYNGHAAVARLFLTLIERRRADAAGLPAEAELWGYARRALKNFRKAAGQFPGGRAPYLLVHGLFQHLTGNASAAAATWRECVAVGERTPMAYEAAMAHWELGRHASAPLERETHMSAARDRFEAMGMPRYAERCATAAAVTA
jgi:class 3 adenylate cyclase/tetratricopeptide (TPR) repeat protein